LLTLGCIGAHKFFELEMGFRIGAVGLQTHGHPEIKTHTEDVVGLCDELCSDGLAFGVVCGEKGWRGKAAVYKGEFPGEVEGVLDTCVAAESEGGWVTTDGVAETETTRVVNHPE
jgi:hypothetical protein